MDPERGQAFYEEAKKNIQEEHLFQRWINGYQTQMNFDEFKRQIHAPENNQKTVKKKELSEEETYVKVRNILRKE